MFAHIATGLACIFLGSIPFGYIIGRLKGVDLREHGSGNTGATNTARVLGKSAGIITLVLDMLKGGIAVYLGSRLDLPDQQLWAPVGGVLALFGHCFSPFLRFRGGKGVATGLGAFLVLTPGPAAIAIGVFLFVLRWTRYVSLASILAASTIPVLIYSNPKGATQVLLLSSILSSSLVVLRHRSNIRRLAEGTEPKWGKKKEVAPTPQAEAAK